MLVMFYKDSYILFDIYRVIAVLKRNKSWWVGMKRGPPDTVFGLTNMFLKCRHPKKVNLALGAYRDDRGNPVVLTCVRKAEKIIHTMYMTKEYLPSLGTPLFQRLTSEVLYGPDSAHIKNGVVSCAHVLSRTGGLRVAAAFLNLFYTGPKTVFISTPTWSNHKRILTHAGLPFREYRYYDSRSFTFDKPAFIEDMKKCPDRSIVLLHACAHNPTGVDPTEHEWDEVSAIFKQKKHLAIFDMHSQGFATGNLEKDAYGLRQFVRDNNPVIAVLSFSKNMGLYGERVGALTFVCEDVDEAIRVSSQLKIIIRGLYSNPPLHGGRLVIKILDDPGLKAMWEQECEKMHDRLVATRALLQDKLVKQGSTRNWNHLITQRGPFSFIGLNHTQVKKLINDYSIFLTESGRVSICGLNVKNIDYVAHAIHLITK